MIKLINKKFTWAITGGAGFIGSNLINELITNKQKVICIDNFSTGSFGNIKVFLKNKNFKLIKKDIRDEINLNIKVDFFIHLAALGSVPKSFENPIETNDVNVSGSLKMFFLANKLKAKKFIFASSSAVYGNSKNKIKKEDDKLNPISPYGLSKYIFEKYLSQIYNDSPMAIYGLRFFNVFGPRQNENGPYAPVISKWVRNAFDKKDLVLFGDKEISRDFTYVENITDSIINLCLIKIKKSKYEIFNIATDNPQNLYNVYKKIKKELKKFNIFPKLVIGKPRNGDIKISKSNISKAMKYFNYRPIVYFDQGLRKYINFLIENEKK